MRAWIATLLLAACGSLPAGGGDDASTSDGGGGDGDGGGGGGAVDVFAATTTRVVVEIDYETGQQPYTGMIVGFGDTFEPTLTNIDRVFAGTKELTIPTTVAQMQDIGQVGDEELTVQDILALSAQHRDAHDAADVKTYHVLFVSGHFADDSGVRATVLGVSIGDTIAMFKDVIRDTNVIGFPNVVRYVEQSTLIHELAHSIGLVDNGVALTTAHKDDAHGAHCTNEDCVMYWLNEGASDAAAFAQRRLLTGSTILFDAACLGDVDAKTGGP